MVGNLEFLLSNLEKLEYSGNKTCLHLMNEQLNDILYCLEARGPEADRAILHIRACCWMLFEGKHVNTEEQFFITFHYIKDKTFRACKDLIKTMHKERSAA